MGNKYFSGLPFPVFIHKAIPLVIRTALEFQNAYMKKRTSLNLLSSDLPASVSLKAHHCINLNSIHHSDSAALYQNSSTEFNTYVTRSFMLLIVFLLYHIHFRL